jgi:tRNA nucleotidyltransferase (CCA-adding enzyme)
MAEINLSNEIQALPEVLLAALVQAVNVAGEQGQPLFLVGGAVRDMLLAEAVLDVDLVVEGDAIGVAQKLAAIQPGRLTVHRRFGTAKLAWHEWSLDLASARAESYPRPGSLPAVTRGSLKDDLFRRDFTINAMAVSLNPDSYGRLVDYHGGLTDLRAAYIRVLHEQSFRDDATRIWRAIRYEQRLDFEIEPRTLAWLERDLSLLQAISGDRIWYELECTLKEDRPEKALARGAELGLLAELQPGLRGDGWLADKFVGARLFSEPEKPGVGMYLALLTYRLPGAELAYLVDYLHLNKTLRQTLLDTCNLSERLDELSDPGLPPSRVYQILRGHSTQAVIANLLASNTAAVRRHIQLYLDKLCIITTALDGQDLIKMGIPPGPAVKEALDGLLSARLDGLVKDREAERAWVQRKRLQK